MQKKILDLLTVCRKAGKLVIGFDPVKDAVLNNKSRCVIVSCDISPKTLKEISFFSQKADADILRLEISMDELAHVFRKKIAVMAVTDNGFALALKKLCDCSDCPLPD